MANISRAEPAGASFAVPRVRGRTHGLMLTASWRSRVAVEVSVAAGGFAMFVVRHAEQQPQLPPPPRTDRAAYKSDDGGAANTPPMSWANTPTT